MEKQTKIVSSVVGAAVIIAAVLGGINHHQSTHFNKNTSINGVNVGGLTSQQAYQKVKQTKLSNDVYFNGQKIYDGTETSSGITSSDQSKFAAALKKQKTFFPSSKTTNLTVKGSDADTSQQAAMKAAATTAINEYNAGKTMAVDAQAVLKNGKITVTKAKSGNALDVDKMLQGFNDQKYSNTVKLTKIVKTPVKADIKTIDSEKQKLEALQNKTVDFKVNDTTVKLSAKNLITSATYSNGQYNIDTTAIKKKIAQINSKYATLGRSFKFKTHSGSTITTSNAGTYGWKIDPDAAANAIVTAFSSDKTKALNAEDFIYGTGYNENGTGYGVTANDGIGDTYVEVSISAQHAWWYKDGKLVYEASVVTGTEDGSNATPKGVYYIMYKQTNTTLRGQNDNGSSYASPVSYWAPFTQSGCGFHDASWRTDWSSTAYLTGGSHGCVNMHTYDAGTAYADMEQNEPVVIY